MKKLSILFALAFLAGCAGMGADTSGPRGRSGSTIMGGSDNIPYPSAHDQSVFDPANPYHGG